MHSINWFLWHIYVRFHRILLLFFYVHFSIFFHFFIRKHAVYVGVWSFCYWARTKKSTKIYKWIFHNNKRFNAVFQRFYLTGEKFWAYMERALFNSNQFSISQTSWIAITKKRWLKMCFFISKFIKEFNSTFNAIFFILFFRFSFPSVCLCIMLHFNHVSRSQCACLKLEYVFLRHFEWQSAFSVNRTKNWRLL